MPTTPSSKNSLRISTTYVAAQSLKKDLKNNNVPFEVLNKFGTILIVPNNPKARTMIQMVKERFGMRSIIVTELES